MKGGVQITNTHALKIYNETLSCKINDPSRSLSKEQINDTTGLSGHHEISTVDRTMKSSTSKKQKRTDENRYNKTERKPLAFITVKTFT
jgi:hypothetical protein